MRKRNNIICSCKGEAIISFQNIEEIERQKRRNSFMRSNCQTAELYLFSISLRKNYEQFKLETK
jgi:hypothetical protein